jgi:hypothetical protein
VRGWVVYLWAFLGIGLSIGAWSLATPLGSAPDEPTQMLQGVAIVRGHFDGRQVPLTYAGIPVGRIGLIEVPRWATDVPNLRDVPDAATCSQRSCDLVTAVPDNSPTVLTGTQFSNYPPLYYLSVGWPTLFTTGHAALYAERIASVLLNSALIALGLFLLARYHHRQVLVGALVALAPMVLFISAVVSSSGMEAAAGFAAWCAALCIAHADPVPRPLVAWTAVSFVALILDRPLSPYNAVVILAVVGVIAGWARCRLLFAQLRPLWVAVLGAFVVSGAFLLVAGSPTLTGYGEHPPVSFARGVWLTLRLTPGVLRQLLGNFGWLDVPAPVWTQVIWGLAASGLVIWALAVSPRTRRALPLLALAVLVMPVLFEVPKLNAVGAYWTGRYWLPLAVGVPLVASTAVMIRRRLVLALAVALTAAQIGALVTALHAYGAWAPPGDDGLVIALFVVGWLLVVGFLLQPESQAMAATPATSTTTANAAAQRTTMERSLTTMI